ncbi:MAG: hypothetical protein AAF620_01260 [Bacteroidota bacterium]
MLGRFSIYFVFAFNLSLFLPIAGKGGANFKMLYDSAKKYKSIEIGLVALDSAKKNDNVADIAKAHYLIAFYQNKKAMYYGALNHYFSALHYYGLSENYNRQISTMKNIALIYSVGGFYKKSIEFYQDALALAIEIRDNERAESIKYVMARSYRLDGDIAQAKSLYMELLEQPVQIRNKKLLVDICLELALISGTYEKDYSKAEEYLNRSVELEPKKDPYTISYAELTRYNDLAYFKLMDGDLVSAKQLLKNGLAAVDQAAGFEDLLVKMYGNLAKVLDKEGKMDECVLMYEEALKVRPYMKFDNNYLSTAKFVYDHYKQNDAIKADKYAQLMYEYGKAKDQLQAELQKASQEYQILAADYKRKLDLKIAEQRQENIREIIIYSIFFICIVSSTVFIFFDKIQRRKRFQAALKDFSIIHN